MNILFYFSFNLNQNTEVLKYVDRLKLIVSNCCKNKDFSFFKKLMQQSSIKNTFNVQITKYIFKTLNFNQFKTNKVNIINTLFSATIMKTDLKLDESEMIHLDLIQSSSFMIKIKFKIF